MVFKNEAQLKSFLLKKCKAAVADTQKEVYEKFDEKVDVFYGEFFPDVYERTNKLYSSLSATKPIQSGNGTTAKVWFDVGCLDYTTGSWSGEQVLDTVMSSGYPHGGYASGTAIWSVGMNELGDIKEKTAQALRAQGVSIIKG